MDVAELLQGYLTFLQSNIPLIAGVVLGTVVWLMSGCVASTIAELRRRSPWLHLFAGLLIPWVYPLLIFFVMTVRREEKGEKETVAEHAEGAPPPKKIPGAAQKAMAAELDFSAEAEVVPDWNPARLKEMSTTLEGNPRGPFVFLLKDGHEQRAERILDALPMAVAIEIIDPAGKPQKLRIPYDEIDTCTEL